MNVQPYLFFDGRCDEALKFYQRVLGAEIIMLMRFKESPDQRMIEPGSEEKVMHCSFRVGDSVMSASDGNCKGKAAFEGFSLTISVATAADADRVFSALSEGGKVQMPLSKTFFSEKFGMLADAFGVPWMILVEQKR